ncbi:MAG: helix-turn-helix domain-containing protein [Oscillospiraceae bacterium]|nr:helix-turn-helix domain-containing protein [Oscillospiraceae bacterium]
MKRTGVYKYERLPFSIIKKATEQKETALAAVLNHYSLYLDSCATRYVQGIGKYIDEDIRQYAIERLLIAVTTAYDITRLS